MVGRHPVVVEERANCWVDVCSCPSSCFVITMRVCDGYQFDHIHVLIDGDHDDDGEKSIRIWIEYETETSIRNVRRIASQLIYHHHAH